jgi:hypothetical protein
VHDVEGKTSCWQSFVGCCCWLIPKVVESGRGQRGRW